MEKFDHVPFPPVEVPGGQGGGFTGWIDGVLFSGTFFAIFFAVIAVFIAAVTVFVVVQLVRGKGRRRYVVMEVDDTGNMRPVGMAGTGLGLDAHNAAHAQAMQMQNQQMLNQQNNQAFPPGM